MLTKFINLNRALESHVGMGRALVLFEEKLFFITLSGNKWSNRIDIPHDIIKAKNIVSFTVGSFKNENKQFWLLVSFTDGAILRYLVDEDCSVQKELSQQMRADNIQCHHLAFENGYLFYVKSGKFSHRHFNDMTQEYRSLEPRPELVNLDPNLCGPSLVHSTGNHYAHYFLYDGQFYSSICERHSKKMSSSVQKPNKADERYLGIQKSDNVLVLYTKKTIYIADLEACNIEEHVTFEQEVPIEEGINIVNFYCLCDDTTDVDLMKLDQLLQPQQQSYAYELEIITTQNNLIQIPVAPSLNALGPRKKYNIKMPQATFIAHNEIFGTVCYTPQEGIGILRGINDSIHKPYPIQYKRRQTILQSNQPNIVFLNEFLEGSQYDTMAIAYRPGGYTLDILDLNEATSIKKSTLHLTSKIITVTSTASPEQDQLGRIYIAVDDGRIYFQDFDNAYQFTDNLSVFPESPNLGKISHLAADETILFYIRGNDLYWYAVNELSTNGIVKSVTMPIKTSVEINSLCVFNIGDNSYRLFLLISGKPIERNIRFDDESENFVISEKITALLTTKSCSGVGRKDLITNKCRGMSLVKSLKTLVMYTEKYVHFFCFYSPFAPCQYKCIPLVKQGRTLCLVQASVVNDNRLILRLILNTGTLITNYFRINSQNVLHKFEMDNTIRAFIDGADPIAIHSQGVVQLMPAHRNDQLTLHNFPALKATTPLPQATMQSEASSNPFL